jgi:hypothetical protein
LAAFQKFDTGQQDAQEIRDFPNFLQCREAVPEAWRVGQNIPRYAQ